MGFFLPFSIRLGASVMVLSGGIMTAAVLFFYRSTTGLVEEQMVAHVRSMARTGAALLSASQLASIQRLNTLSTKPAPVDLNTLPDGETVDLLSETQIASLQARPDFQDLVQILRRVRAGSQKRVPGPGFLQQAAPPDNEPLIRFVYLAAAIAEEPEHRVVKFLADSSYETIDENNNGVIDDDELPTNIGMLYRIDSQDGFQKAFTGVAAANSELTHDKWGIWISAFAPVIDEAGRTVAVLGVDYDVRSEFNKLQTLWNLCLALILISLIFSLILSILLSRWITRPIDELRSTADQVRLGNLQIRSTLDQKRHDELSLLATTFNEMLVQIEDSIEQQRMAIVELQNAARMKDEFLSNISHEMNTPLAVLVGHLEMVRDGLVRTENLPAIHKILHAQALGLTHILQNIILVTRIESGEIHLKPEGVEPESVLEAVLLRVQASLDRSLSLEREISSQTLVVDRFALETILEELLRNAATHGLSGTPETPIEIRFLPSGISIRDHGAGIAADQIDLVTDRFHRVDSTLTYEVTGIGLGLFICRELCRLLGWTLSLQNHPSGGLDVTVAWSLDVR